MPQKKNKASKSAKKSQSSAASVTSPAPQRSNGLSFFIAIIAFTLGVLSPPSLHLFRHVTSQKSTASPATSMSAVEVVQEVQEPSSKWPLPPHTPCSSSNLANYVHDTPVQGLHIVCIEALLGFGSDGKAIVPPSNYGQQQHQLLENSNTLRFSFLNESVKPKLYQRKNVVGPGTGGVGSIHWNQIKHLLIHELRLAPEGPRQQPWAIFTPLGERIIGLNDQVSMKESEDENSKIKSNAQILEMLASSGMVLVFQGGQWRWPGVREGFQRHIELSPALDFAKGSPAEKRNITVETLSLTPLVVSIKGFLTDRECDHIANKARPRMQYSGVTNKDADVGKAASNWRTSQSTFLSSGGDPILTAIDHRTASLTRIPKVHQEVLQVLRYGEGEKYDTHHDYFDPKDYRSDKNTMGLIQHGRTNRFATVFWYLTNVKEGGETIFPRYQNKPLPLGYQHSDCRNGLKVNPQKGKVIIFYSLDSRGQMDPTSLHGACPVIGEDDVKWAANKWIWLSPMGFTPED